MKPPFSVSGKSYRDSGSPIVSGLSENKSNKPVVTSTNTETVENFSLAGKVIKSLFNVFSKSYRDSNLPLVSKHLENKIDKPIVGSINVSYSPTFSLVGSGQTIREFEIDSVKHVLGRLRTLPGIPLTDDITAFELFSFQLRRTLSDFIDPAGIDDIAFFDTNKGIKDFPIAGDGDIFFQISFIRQDLSVASENFTFQYSKPLQDTFSADESFTFQYGKLPSDLTGPITDSSTLSFNKGPSDFANASVALNYIVDKILSDTALAKDLLGITDGSTFSFGMAESDRAVILEQILVALGIYVYYSDSAQAFDNNLIFNIFKSLDDQAKSLEDFTFNLIKTLFDLAQANENAVLTFSKSLPLDSASASDADPTFITDKGLSDLFNIIEDAIWTFNKGEFDVSNANENLVWLYNKPQFDSAQALENAVWLFNKSQFDTSNVSDNQFLNSNKGLSNTTELNDEILTYSLQKVLSDISNALDLVGINDGSTFQFNMVEASLVRISESIQLVLQTFRDLTESVTSSESLNYQINKSISDTSLSSDSNIFDIQKVYSDVSQIIEALALSFNMGNISEYLNVNENSVINTGKNLSDVANISEIISVLIDLRRAIDDTVNASEDLSLAIEKVLNDTTLAKDLLGVTDGSTFTFGMVEGDIITSTENLNFNSNKVLTDLSNIPDDYFLYQQTYFDSDYIVNGQAYVVFNYRSDLFDIYGLPFTELLDASDVSFIGFNKSPQDIVNPSDTQVLITDKGVSDLTDAIDDNLQLTIAKVLADTTLAKDLLGVTDGSTFTFGMVEGDITNASESISTILDARRSFIDYADAVDVFTRIVSFVRDFTETVNTPQTYELFSQNYFDSDYIVNGQSYAVFNYRSPLVNIFGLPFTELLNVNENLLLTSGKFLSESLAASENSEIAVGKSFSDAINVAELLIIAGRFYKVLTDTALAKDLLGVTDGSTFTFGMVEGEIANANEVFTKIVEYNRVFDNQVNISESISTLVSFIRKFNESLEASQTYELFSQNYFDSDYIVNGQSYVVFNYRSPLVNIFGLPFTESLQISEIINLYLGKPLSENLSISDDNQITFNKPIVDNTEVSESLFNAISKTLADTTLAKDLLGVTDGSTFTFGMVEGDQINISESIFKEVNYNRSFTDQLNIPDLFELIFVVNRHFTESLEADQTYELFSQNYFDSDYIVNGQSYAVFNYRSPTINIFGLPFTESLSIPETSVWTFNKDKFDLLQSTDTSTIHVGKNPSDQINISDINPDFVVSKILTDTVLGKDLLGVSDGSTFFFGMSEGDVANASESFTKIVDYNRLFTDQVNTTDLIELLLIFNRNFAENLEADQTYELFTQNYFDSDYIVNGQSYAAFNYRSPTINIFGLPFTESPNAIESAIIELDKILSDTASASENSIIELDKILSDTASASENNVIAFNKSNTDTVEGSENLSYTINKILFDTSNALDLVGINDGSTFQFNMAEADQSRASENKVIDFNKARADIANATETSDLGFNKVRADQARASENNVIDFNKVRADQANVTESLTKSIEYNRSFIDTSEVTETIELLVQTLKDFIDTANVSDPYLIYKQNYFDGDTYSIGYAAYEYRSPTSNGYYLPFTNTANVTETSDLNIGKNQNEQITANDQSNLDIDKDISDTAETGDSGVVYLQSYFAEDYVEFTYALESTAF